MMPCPFNYLSTSPPHCKASFCVSFSFAAGIIATRQTAVLLSAPHLSWSKRNIKLGRIVCFDFYQIFPNWCQIFLTFKSSKGHFEVYLFQKLPFHPCMLWNPFLVFQWNFRDPWSASLWLIHLKTTAMVHAFPLDSTVKESYAKALDNYIIRWACYVHRNCCFRTNFQSVCSIYAKLEQFHITVLWIHSLCSSDLQDKSDITSSFSTVRLFYTPIFIWVLRCWSYCAFLPSEIVKISICMDFCAYCTCATKGFCAVLLSLDFF